MTDPVSNSPSNPKSFYPPVKRAPTFQQPFASMPAGSIPGAPSNPAELADMLSQEIVVLPIERQPHFVLVFDCSGSTKPVRHILQRGQECAVAALARRRSVQPLISVVVFHTRAHILQPFLSVKDTQKNPVDLQTPHGWTNFESMFAALIQLGQVHPGSILDAVVYTDGRASRGGEDGLLELPRQELQERAEKKAAEFRGADHHLHFYGLSGVNGADPAFLERCAGTKPTMLTSAAEVPDHFAWAGETLG